MGNQFRNALLSALGFVHKASCGHRELSLPTGYHLDNGIPQQTLPGFQHLFLGHEVILLCKAFKVYDMWTGH